MRETYDLLTDATRDGLTDNVKAAAAGWGKCLQYLYDILTGDRQDPFARFRSFYAGLCKGGVATAPWDNDLAYVRQLYAKGESGAGRSLADAIRDNYGANTRTMTRWLEMIEDGLTPDELAECERLIDDEIRRSEEVKRALFAARAKHDDR